MFSRLFVVITLSSALLFTRTFANDCEGLLSCEECTLAKCGWCINTRRCVSDLAWQCAGEVDHIGALTGKKCPSRAELAASRAAHRAAAALAAAPVPNATSAEAVIAVGLTWTTSSPEHAADLSARAAAARSKPTTTTAAGAGGAKGGSRGTREPYKTLLIDKSATAREIRRAYKALATRLHPDKNLASPEDASAAFADVTSAFELLSDAPAREIFDATANGGSAFFNDEQTFKASGQQFSEGLYTRAPLVTELSESVFATSFTAGRVWLLIFYAPWCGHCQQAVPVVSAAAEALSDNDMGVDVGAINCAKYESLCGRADVREYPSYRLMANGMGGLSQTLPFASAQNADAIAEWTLEVAREWRWLMSAGDVATITGEIEWDAFILNTTKTLALVLCVDASESGPARTAKTNLLRLAASVGPQRAVARIIDCDMEDSIGSNLCIRLGLPAPPFAPVLRVCGVGNKTVSDIGVPLYSPADVDPHVALAIAETVIRLAINVADDGDNADDDVKKANFDKETKKKEDDEENPAPPPSQPTTPERPKLNWGGPARPKTNSHFGGGGSAPAAPRLS